MDEKEKEIYKKILGDGEEGCRFLNETLTGDLLLAELEKASKQSIKSVGSFKLVDSDKVDSDTQKLKKRKEQGEGLENLGMLGMVTAGAYTVYNIYEISKIGGAGGVKYASSKSIKYAATVYGAAIVIAFVGGMTDADSSGNSSGGTSRTATNLMYIDSSTTNLYNGSSPGKAPSKYDRFRNKHQWAQGLDDLKVKKVKKLKARAAGGGLAFGVSAFVYTVGAIMSKTADKELYGLTEDSEQKDLLSIEERFKTLNKSSLKINLRSRSLF